MPKNIELEIRAIIKQKDYKPLLKKIKKIGKLISETNRLSVAFYGTCEKNSFDIKIRITEGKSEIVLKKGDFHSHNRTEFTQSISNKEFLNTVKLFSHFDFYVKVFERTTFNFQFSNNVIVSLVKAGNYSYLEIEKMTDRKNQNKDKKDLENIANSLDVLIVKDKKSYYDFCDILTEKIDWRFYGTKKDFLKLEKLFKKKRIYKN